MVNIMIASVTFAVFFVTILYLLIISTIIHGLRRLLAVKVLCPVRSVICTAKAIMNLSLFAIYANPETGSNACPYKLVTCALMMGNHTATPKHRTQRGKLL